VALGNMFQTSGGKLVMRNINKDFIAVLLLFILMWFVLYVSDFEGAYL
jgi:hypothetical protein